MPGTIQNFERPSEGKELAAVDCAQACGDLAGLRNKPTDLLRASVIQQEDFVAFYLACVCLTRG